MVQGQPPKSPASVLPELRRLHSHWEPPCSLRAPPALTTSFDDALVVTAAWPTAGTRSCSGVAERKWVLDRRLDLVAKCFPGFCKTNLDLYRNDAFKEHPVSSRPRPDPGAVPLVLALHRAGCLAPGLAHEVSTAGQPGDVEALLEALSVGSPRLDNCSGLGGRPPVAQEPPPRLQQVGPPRHLQVSPPLPPKGSDTDPCAISETGVRGQGALGHTRSPAWSAALGEDPRCRASCR